MSDPIQDSDLARRNAEERRITLGAISDPENTKLADGRTVSEVQAETYKAHLAEGRAAEELQIQRTREQSIANDPFYQTHETFVDVPMGGESDIALDRGRRPPFRRDTVETQGGESV